MASSEVENENVSFFKSLFNRRVPQILGIYIGVCWGIVQFTEWLVNRYMFSPHLTELSAVVMLSFIPSACIVAYFHGQPGRNKWEKTERIGIPLNVVIAAVVVFSLFQGKDLGSVSQTVTLRDETGKNVERLVPKSGFRKKLALFYFKNETGDPSLDWFQYGMAHMLEFDLAQDLFMEVKTPHLLVPTSADFDVYKKIEAAGYKDSIGLPLSFQKKIATEIHMDYFLSGKILKDGGDYILESNLYRAKNAHLVSRSSIREKDIFKLIDNLATRLKEDLEIPKGHIEEVSDLPVSETVTASLPAVRLYTLGQNAMVFEKDWAKAEKYFKEAVKEDPTFAYGYSGLVVVYTLTNRMEKVKEAFKSVMEYAYKLPERMQLFLKFGYYNHVKQDPDKQLAVLKMIVGLYPEDLDVYSILALVLTFRGQLDEAVDTYRRMLELDPGRYEIFKKIGELYESRNDYNRALSYHKKFAEHYPKDPGAFETLAGLYRNMGDHEQAKKHYEKALLLKPDSIPVLTTLAEIEADSGHFEAAADQLREALELSKTPDDRMNVYEALSSFYKTRGRLKEAFEYTQLRIKTIEENRGPLIARTPKILSLKDYIGVGKEQEALGLMATLRSESSPPLDKFVAVGALQFYLELEKPGEAEKQLADVKEFIAATGYKAIYPFLFLARGSIHEMRGEYAEALKAYEELLTPATGNPGNLRRIGRCYRHLKRYDKAEEYIRKALKSSPYSPKSHYELALVYLDMGDKEKAAEHLKITVEVWKDADPGYKPAQSAKEKLAQLSL